MDGLFINIFFIFILILINGYLSGTEIAVVTARKSHIKQLAETAEDSGLEEGVMLKLLSTFCMDFPFLRDRLRK
jgi:CBS domain containing-hemolysin-like protein